MRYGPRFKPIPQSVTDRLRGKPTTAKPAFEGPYAHTLPEMVAVLERVGDGESVNEACAQIARWIDGWINVREAASYLDVNQAFVLSLIQSGHLEAKQMTHKRLYLISRASLNAYRDAHPNVVPKHLR